MREVAASSAWGDPGRSSPAELALGLRVAWARRVLEAAPDAADWVAGAGALLVARELLVAEDRGHSDQLRRLPGIGREALAAGSLGELRAALPARAAWALAAVSGPGELWRAELGGGDELSATRELCCGRGAIEAVVLAAVALARARRAAHGERARYGRRGGSARACGADRWSCLSAPSRCGCGGWPWLRLASRVREVLVALAESGTVDLARAAGDRRGAGAGGACGAWSAARRRRRAQRRRLPARRRMSSSSSAAAPGELLAGEVELERRTASAVRARRLCAVRRLGAGAGARAAERRAWSRSALRWSSWRAPRGVEPPTLLAPAPAAEPFRPLLTTYGAVPYEDVDPTPFVAVTYCLMFGMMFGDVGDGLLIVLAALALRRARHPRLQALRKVWPMIAAAGAAAIVFGALYGELFGPTKVLPTLWLAPLDSPTRLLVVAIVAGGGLLAAELRDRDRQPVARRGAALALTASSAASRAGAADGGGPGGARESRDHAAPVADARSRARGGGRCPARWSGCAPRPAAALRRPARC